MTDQEIVNDLLKNLSQQNLESIKNHNRDNLIEFHRTLGQYIRHRYKLWEVYWEPVLIDGVDHSCNHPDQRSMDIIECLYKRLNPVKPESTGEYLDMNKPKSYLKLYIATLDDAPDYMYGTLVAHSVVGAHLAFQNEPLYQEWLKDSFRKVTIRVSRDEFEKIRNLDQPVYEGHENTILNGEKSCLVTLARHGEVPKELYTCKLWKPKISI